MKKKISKKIILLVSIIIVSMTTMTTSAYFNSAINFDSLLGNNSSNSKLNIKNGSVGIKFSDSPSTWKITQNGGEIINKNTITNPKENDIAEFGPVTLESTSNLTTNVDLLADYELTTSIDGEEIKNITTKIPCEPFEVIVGDIDNFGYGFGGVTNYDVYSGIRYNRTDYCSGQGEDKDNGLNVYPTNYDATGTDRRMCPSGFYNLIENVIGANNMNNHTGSGNNATDTLLGNNFELYQYLGDKDKKAFFKEGIVFNKDFTVGGNSGAYTVGVLKRDVTINSTKIPKGYRVYWDGYTNRSVRGVRGIGGKDPKQVYVNVSDKNFDGKNWAFLNSPQPITFKYAQIDDEKDVTSAVIQMYVDDFQSGDADKSILGDEQENHFSNDSTSRFTATLGGVEVPELSKLINSLCQSGPAGQLINFNVPQKYLYLIKKYAGTGANEGLQLLIDDARIGTSGDSYCIDFAKLTVNAETSSRTKMNVSGTVVDSKGKGISGVTVVAGDGTSITTDKNGSYSLNITPGIIDLVFSKSGYVSQNYISSDIYNSDGTLKNNIEIPKVTMEEGGSSGGSDIDGEKFGVEINVEKIKVNDDGTESSIETKTYTSEKPIVYSGTEGKNADCTLALQPNFKYKVTYKLILKNLRNDNNNITLNIKGNLIAKATQENNPAWNEDGTGENYKDSFKEGQSTGQIVEGVAEVKIIAKDTSGNILDDVYAIWNDNKLHCNNASKYDFKANAGASSITVISKGYEDKVVTTDLKVGLNTINVTMENIKPNINFEIPDTGYWGNSTTIKVGDKSYEADKTPFAGWKGVILQKEQLEKLKQSTITVSDNKNNTSGALYYFSTQRVYICTNGSTENTVAANGSIKVNYVDENNNVIGSDTYKGMDGETTTIKAKDIEGYEVDGDSSITAKYSEKGTEITFKYKKLKCVTVEYRDNTNKDIILSTEKHYGKSTDTYSITAKEQIQYNGSYYNINKNETFTGTYDSNKTVTYYYNKCNVTINYVDESGKNIKDTEHKYIKNGEDYTFENETITRYELAEVKVNDSTILESSIKINGDTKIDYIYKLKGVIVHYYNTKAYDSIYAYVNDNDIPGYTWSDNNKFDENKDGWSSETIPYTGENLKVILKSSSGTGQEPKSGGYEVSGEVWIKNGLVYNKNPDEGNIIVHYYGDYTNVAAYVWDDDKNTYNGEWNDCLNDKMTSEGDNWWSYEVKNSEKKSLHVILRYNDGSLQDPKDSKTSGYLCSGEIWIKGGKLYSSKP